MANPNLMELSDHIATLVESAGRSVVRVDSRRAPSSGVVWSADGVVLTADHNLDWDEPLEIGLPDGGSAPAKLVGRDPTTDLAALRVTGAGLAAAPWTDADRPRTGQLLLGLSRPGQALRAGWGLLARSAESWRTPSGGKLDRYLELDLPLHPGFSGGLVIDLAGRTLGLATSGLVRGTALAIPVATLRRVVKSLLAHGAVRRGFLGIATVPVTLPAQLEKQAGRSAALLVTAVEGESPAARGGLMVGDLLISLDGRQVSGMGDLLPSLEEERIGDSVPVQVLRAGSPWTTSLVVGTRQPRAEGCAP
jgi:S1-C subfamily serine protease